jgi:ribonuclease HI
MSKFYAVRNGYKTGIFKDWDSCKEATTGFKGAEFKSFKTELEAQAYLKGEEIGYVSITDSFISIGKPSENEAFLYVDGGYKDGVTSFGCYIETADRNLKFYGTVDYKTSLGNIAAEILGILTGVQLVNDLGIKRVTVHYDYDGLYKWYSNEWRAKGEFQSSYVDILHTLERDLGLVLNFVKVAGHSVLEGNKIADSLATKARNVKNCDVPIEKIVNRMITCKDVVLSSL